MRGRRPSYIVVMLIELCNSEVMISFPLSELHNFHNSKENTRKFSQNCVSLLRTLIWCIRSFTNPFRLSSKKINILETFAHNYEHVAITQQ